MSGEEEPVAWLRRQIEARQALARHAIEMGNAAEWTEQSSGVLVTGGPAGADTWHGTWAMGDSSLTRLMEANDPRDTIARCEAELAILDEHRVARMTYPDVASFGCIRCHYGANGEDYNGGWCTTTRLLASGYRHHDGYAEHWGDQG
jgi:hypothetical protein